MSEWWQGLSERQRLFCEAFTANGGNATKAAKDAGYSSPNPEGTRLLANVSIRKALEQLRLATTTTSIATREERQAFWTAIMRGDEPGEMKDRLKASELLGRSQGDFLDRIESTNKIIIKRKYGLSSCEEQQAAYN